MATLVAVMVMLTGHNMMVMVIMMAILVTIAFVTIGHLLVIIMVTDLCRRTTPRYAA
jgi:hypothetical protein